MYSSTNAGTRFHSYLRRNFANWIIYMWCFTPSIPNSDINWFARHSRVCAAIQFQPIYIYFKQHQRQQKMESPICRGICAKSSALQFRTVKHVIFNKMFISLYKYCILNSINTIRSIWDNSIRHNNLITFICWNKSTFKVACNMRTKRNETCLLSIRSINCWHLKFFLFRKRKQHRPQAQFTGSILLKSVRRQIIMIKKKYTKRERVKKTLYMLSVLHIFSVPTTNCS